MESSNADWLFKTTASWPLDTHSAGPDHPFYKDFSILPTEQPPREAVTYLPSLRELVAEGSAASARSLARLDTASGYESSGNFDVQIASLATPRCRGKGLLSRAGPSGDHPPREDTPSHTGPAVVRTSSGADFAIDPKTGRKIPFGQALVARSSQVEVPSVSALFADVVARGGSGKGGALKRREPSGELRREASQGRTPRGAKGGKGLKRARSASAALHSLPATPSLAQAKFPEAVPSGAHTPIPVAAPATPEGPASTMADLMMPPLSHLPLPEEHQPLPPWGLKPPEEGQLLSPFVPSYDASCTVTAFAPQKGSTPEGVVAKGLLPGEVAAAVEEPLPKKGRGEEPAAAEPALPKEAAKGHPFGGRRKPLLAGDITSSVIHVAARAGPKKRASTFRLEDLQSTYGTEGTAAGAGKGPISNLVLALQRGAPLDKGEPAGLEEHSQR